MSEAVHPRKIETYDELSGQQCMLTTLKTIDAFLKYCKTKTVQALIEALICDGVLNTKSAPATIQSLENRGLLTINHDGTVGATQAFPRYMQQLKKNIALAEDNEKIVSPSNYYRRKFEPEYYGRPELKETTKENTS